MVYRSTVFLKQCFLNNLCLLSKSTRILRLASSYEKTRENLLVTKDSKVICQGFTGKQGTYHCTEAIAYGTKIVGGISPSKAGQTHLEKPVFACVAEAKKELCPDVSLIFVPAKTCYDAIMESIEAEIPLIVTITEGIPQHDMVKIKNALATQEATRMIGPNCPGMISVEECKLGIMPGNIHKRGQIGIVSRSGTLTYEGVSSITKEGMGQTYVFGIGGDPFNGTSFVDCVSLFLKHEETKAIAIMGEIGGTAEEEAVEYLIEHNYGRCRKPVVGYIAGTTAPPGRRMGHAGAIVSGGKGTAQGKIDAFEKAGIPVCKVPSQIGAYLKEELRKKEEQERECCNE